MFREQVFRVSLLPLVGAALVGFFVSLGLFALRLGTQILTPNPIMLLGVIALVAFCVAVRAIFPTYVGPDGIRGCDGIGRYHDVPWDKIQSVQRFVGFYWIDHGKSGSRLCIPVIMDSADAFRAYVRQKASPANPLVAKL